MKRLLGIDFEQLQQLLEQRKFQGKFLHQKKQEEKEKEKIKIIKGGGGCPAKLSIEEQIILFRYKTSRI